MQKNVLAFDFGASSGRAIVGVFKEGALELDEIHRFVNYPIEKEGHLFWDINYLFEQVLLGIQKACQKYKIDSLGIDTWGVDFGLLNKEGELLQNPYNYRDTQTIGMIEKVKEQIDLNELYHQTGNQIMEINTLFQLLAIKNKNPELFESIDKILFMPDLMNYLLTGTKAAEMSIASTSQMIDVHTNQWAENILSKFNIPVEIMPKLVESGNFLGKTKASLGIPEIPVYNICEHDTASAVISIPSNQKFLFVSCGTWSLVGTELPMPIVNEKAYRYNLTNEKGINNTTRFLKNCTGLWIIQELRRNFEEVGRKYSFAELADLASEAKAFKCWIDTDDPLFSTPGNMVSRIQNYALETNQEIPETDGELARCIYESLAMKYKYTFLEINDATEMEFDTVNIVGGGSQAEILCQMVSDAANMRVCAGPVEATAIGNIAAQLLAQGVFSNIYEVREWVKKTTAVKYYFPGNTKNDWDQEFSNYQKIIEKRGVLC